MSAGGLYTLVILAVGFFPNRSQADQLMHLDVVLRYGLGSPAAMIAGIALARRSKRYSHEGEPRLAESLTGAAIGFIVYSLTQLIVPRTDFFPSMLINTANFIAVAGFPIQIVRAAMALVITVSLTYAANILEKNRQAQLHAAEQARLDAVERLRIELLDREAMRQDLMRNIVLAQEDERTRIAHELHDETSQTLTAFTFHLAVLRQMTPKSSKAHEQLEYLQSLSRQMSQDLYRLVRDLRPAQLDDLGLTAALQYLVEENEKRTGLAVALNILGERRRLDSLVETVLFRVAQEALTNVARHSGVHTARLTLEFLPDQVRMQVQDDGVGFQPDRAVDL